MRGKCGGQKAPKTQVNVGGLWLSTCNSNTQSRDGIPREHWVARLSHFGFRSEALPQYGGERLRLPYINPVPAHACSHMHPHTCKHIHEEHMHKEGKENTRAVKSWSTEIWGVLSPRLPAGNSTPKELCLPVSLRPSKLDHH